MILSRKGTDWIQKELLIKESIKFNSKMKIDIKKIFKETKDISERLEGNHSNIKDA